MPQTPVATGRPGSPDARPTGQRQAAFDRRRAHIAVIASVVAVSLFGYVLLPQRTVRVLADGRELVLQTHSSNDNAVLRGSGVELEPGDRVTALDGDGIDVLRVERARDVLLAVDGASLVMRSHAATVDQLLEEAGVAIGDRDSVVLGGALVASNAELPPGGGDAPLVAVEVRRAVPFVIAEDGAETLSTSSRPTVAQALREAGVHVGPGDLIDPPVEAPLAGGARIDVRHARALTVTLPSDHRVLYTHELTVGDALRVGGIQVPEAAFIDPPESAPVTDGMSVRVVVLSSSDEEEREFIEHRTVYRLDPSLRPGQVRTVPGHDGVLVRRYVVGYANGAEASRELLDESYETEPADTVVYYPPPSGAADAPPVEGVARVMRVYATWYNAASSGRAPTDPAYGHTATGVQVTYGIVAVDPTVIPLGTRMFIPGYGYGVAADTGGAVKGAIIDLGYPDGVDVPWRPQWLDIYILS